MALELLALKCLTVLMCWDTSKGTRLAHLSGLLWDPRWTQASVAPLGILSVHVLASAWGPLTVCESALPWARGSVVGSVDRSALLWVVLLDPPLAHLLVCSLVCGWAAPTAGASVSPLACGSVCVLVRTTACQWLVAVLLAHLSVALWVWRSVDWSGSLWADV